MNVIYAADENYAGIMMVSILSLCRHNRNLNIIVFDYGISDHMKLEIRKLIDKIGEKIGFIKGEELRGKFNLPLKVDRGSLAQFSRLFIQKYVPENWERVLYLDCDTLIVSNLDELYGVNLEYKTVAGVLDAFGKLHKKALGLKPGDPYINSGMLLINLKRWKKCKVEDRFTDFIINKRGRVLQGDQGIINAVLSKEICILPPRWNLITYHFDFTYFEMCLYRKPSGYYTELEINKEKEIPKIVHFTSSFASMRPWECEKSIHPFFEEWDKIFRECRLSKQIKRIKVSCILWKYLPHRLMLDCIGVVHAYIKPLCFF